jgi:hypothetical protein
MFERLYQVIDNVLKLDSTKVGIEIYGESEVQRFIIDLNRIEQLFKKGVDSDNKPIGYYSEVTDIFTQGQSFSFEGLSSTKRAGNHYTLLDTGYFYRSFQVHLTGTGFIIEADDEKEDTYLTDRYGLEILGLSDLSKDELAAHIIGTVIELVRTKMLA